ncbi:hypothetical protein B0H65DRAFT_481118 [Neurospora tetraspora]|uniref:Uncharacterized protein n=1 Tax=Neurospora tetraspora TaxID=94610 RepID=A0AAE0J0C5_9PEZI|nr:hypothetical protein B0H65DRAFT_481118 [Neurospora tetraspora]
MDTIKKKINKGLDKATGVNNEPQVLNKSSQSHALNITGIKDHQSSPLTSGLEKPQDPSKGLGAVGTGMTATGVSTGTNPNPAAARQ